MSKARYSWIVHRFIVLSFNWIVARTQGTLLKTLHKAVDKEHAQRDIAFINKVSNVLMLINVKVVIYKSHKITIKRDVNKHYEEDPKNICDNFVSFSTFLRNFFRQLFDHVRLQMKINFQTRLCRLCDESLKFFCDQHN